MNTEITKQENATCERTQYRRPAYDVRETDNDFIVEVTMPGVSKSAVSVSLENGQLELIGNRKHHTPEDWKALHREIIPHDYRLRLTLNVKVNEEAISASMEDGILTLTLPKAEEVKARKIEIA